MSEEDGEMRVAMRNTVILVIVLGAAGCAADLRVVDKYDPADDQLGRPQPYCVPSGSALLVTIENVGNADAGASRVRIDYYDNAIRYGSVPAIPKGEIRSVRVDEEDCYKAQQKCTFTITADWDKAVRESDEDNNTADGECLP